MSKRLVSCVLGVQMGWDMGWLVLPACTARSGPLVRYNLMGVCPMSAGNWHRGYRGVPWLTMLSKFVCVPCCSRGAAEEWRHLAGLHADKTGVAALVLGAVVLAPLTEVRYSRLFLYCIQPSFEHMDLLSHVAYLPTCYNRRRCHQCLQKVFARRCKF